jgi:hypothetical protein
LGSKKIPTPSKAPNTAPMATKMGKFISRGAIARA